MKPKRGDSKREIDTNPFFKSLAPYNQDKKNGPVFDLFWHDQYIDQSKLLNLKRYQRVNHFPAMSGITSKA